MSAVPERTNEAPAAAVPSAPEAFRRFGMTELMLYAAVVFAWGTSWIAIKYQVDAVSPEIAIVWRFLIAAPLMGLLAAVRGEGLRFPLRTHLSLVALGLLLFSTNFILFYHGGKYLPSGLLSVIFSMASLTNLILAWVFLEERPSRRVALGGLIGVLGVAALFEPQWSRDSGSMVMLGVAFCLAGTLSFSFGNMVSSRLQRRKVPVLASSAWGMAYGVGWAALFGLILGQPFIFDPRPPFVIALVWLAVSASVLAFACYLTLLGRIGAARAGYATVMFPALALAISALLEDFPLTPIALTGFALVAAGNLLVLRR